MIWPPVAVFEKVRSWGFGAMLGGAGLALLQLFAPGLFPGATSPVLLLLLGGLLGGGVQQFVRPAAPYADFLARLAIILGPGKALGHREQQRVTRQLVRAYALRGLPSESRQSDA
jgi:hypothetical protein